MNRTPYDSDVTDTQWEILKPIIEKEYDIQCGRPRKIDLREVINAIFYLRAC